MNTLRVCTLLSALVGIIFGLQSPIEARAGTAAPSVDHILTSELVITDAAGNQFRLVRCRGSFTAPAGMSLEALDGKPVRVEIGRDGLVLRITQMPIHIEPITHTFDVVSGQLVVRDTAARTFAIAGDDVTYTAPSGADIAHNAGRLVEMRVDERGQVMGIEPIAQSADAPPRSSGQCTLSDASLAHGVAICRHGATFRCTNGEWVDTGAACS